jgi:hypothetical protein
MESVTDQQELLFEQQLVLELLWWRTAAIWLSRVYA